MDSERKGGHLIIHDLEVEVGDSGPSRLRVPKRFGETEKRYPSASPLPDSVAASPGFLIVAAHGEDEWLSYDKRTVFVKAEIVDDPDQTFLEFDAAERADLIPAFRLSLSLAYENAKKAGVDLEPHVEDAAAFVDRLPRGRKISPREAPGGFSMI